MKFRKYCQPSLIAAATLISNSVTPMGLRLCCVRIIRGVERCRAVSSGVERCRAVSRGVEGCRGVSRCRVWHLDTDEHGFSLDGVEGCRGVSRGVEFVELAWVVEVSSRCRGLV